METKWRSGDIVQPVLNPGRSRGAVTEPRQRGLLMAVVLLGPVRPQVLSSQGTHPFGHLTSPVQVAQLTIGLGGQASRPQCICCHGC